jgi:hypothetical protein
MKMTTTTVYGLDDLEEAFERDAIKRGDLCEVTTIGEFTAFLPVIQVDHEPEGYRGRHVRQGDPRWAVFCRIAGTILVFLSLVGFGVIGGVLCLQGFAGK